MFLRENTWPSQHPLFMLLFLLLMKFCICLAPRGHLSVPNTVLYPVNKIEWCMYGLFIRNQGLVREQSLVDSHVRHTNLALNLDGYIWAVSSLASDRIQVCCLERNPSGTYHSSFNSYLHW